MHYQKLNLESSRFLSEMVHSVYVISTHEQALCYQAVPNGYIGLTMILQGRSYTEATEDQRCNAWVLGMITEPLKVFHSSYSVEITVVFHPVKLRSFIRMPMQTFAHGYAVPAEEVFPKGAMNQLLARLHARQEEQNVLTSLETFLKGLYSEDHYHLPSLEAYNAIQRLEVLEVGDLANTMGVSTTTLRNWSSDYIGLSPKELLQVMRFQKVLTEKKVDNLTDLAYRFQYFDQAHFTKTFRKLSGMNPSRYFSDERFTFDFYKYGRWLENTFEKK